jgi:hypothetical protein
VLSLLLAKPQAVPAVKVEAEAVAVH